MSHQLSTLFSIALLISLVLTQTQAARPAPALAADSLVRTQQHELRTDVKAENVDVEESCEGVEGKEGCLMRRTLAAHLDYIYTQKHKP
ncbi:phytosulfokines-like [Corylus avellana]|uniref:phytosulfokines-like n=1 Tax=Corylus avellana TaxID=13451 RepID=UPI00286AFC3B|nr:phytosulfokines-like [Corylus avellana]